MPTRSLTGFVAGQKLRGVDMQTMPRGWLGWAEVTATQSGIGNTGVDITGLAVQVNLEADRLLRVSARVQWVETSSGDVIQQVVTEIREGNTPLQRHQSSYAGLTGEIRDTHNTWALVDGPTAGLHTYKVLMYTAGSGAVIETEADATYPLFIAVEDLGPAST